MQTVLVTALTVLVGGFLLNYVIDGIYNDSFARTFVDVLVFLNINEKTAVHLYWQLIGDNKTFFMIVGYLILFALFFYVVDVLEFRKWTLFFTVIGMNSITIYLAQRFIRFSYTSEAIFGGLAKLMPETAQPLVSAIAYIAVCWGFLYFLYRQRIFLKV